MKPRKAQIFVSYRRADSEAITGRLAERLGARYGHRQVKLDIDSIPYGRDFRLEVTEMLRNVDVVLAIVGPAWGGPNQGGGKPRIFDEDDPVRNEIETAVANHKRIVPVLVGNARMLGAHELPGSLRSFSTLNAVTLSAGRDFDRHVTDVFAAIDGTIRDAGLALPQAVGDREAGPASRDLLRTAAKVALVIFCPIAALQTSMVPAAPDAIAYVASALNGAAFWMVGQAAESMDPQRRRRIARLTFLAMIASVVLSIFILSFFTYGIPGSSRRFATGFQCTQEALQLYEGRCPFLDPDLVSGADYHAEALWTAQSVAIVRFGLAASWLAAFALLSAFLSLARGRKSG